MASATQASEWPDGHGIEPRTIRVLVSCRLEGRAILPAGVTA
jgi:hypothetical protein